MERKWKVVIVTGWFPTLTKQVIGSYGSYLVAETVALIYQLINPFCWVGVEKPE